VKKELVILTLIFITYSLTLNQPPLKPINETLIGDYIRIRGEIKSYADPPRLTIMNLSDGTGTIKAVFFSEVSGWKGQTVEITGRVAEYKGEIELKGVKIKYLN